jgi:hypothetical protein
LFGVLEFLTIPFVELAESAAATVAGLAFVFDWR